jgi:hypothetical protein
VETLNAELTKEGKAPVKVRLAPEDLEVEVTSVVKSGHQRTQAASCP